ncbi:MAG: hypothetical protein ACHQFW_02870 [Chitinophagales bacterium]
MSINPILIKTKNYRQVALIEILLIFFVLIMGDLTKSISESRGDQIVTSVLLILEAFYLLLLFQLVRFLQSNTMFAKIFMGFIIVVFILSFIALNPFVEIVADKIPWLIAVHIILCSMECFVIGLGLRDIYDVDLRIAERLWGSVAVYLLIALGWASFYEIIVLATPTGLGVSLTPGYQTYSESLYYSLCSISGTGTVYTNPSHLVRNLALIEAVWGVLFLVMLIGRLFSLPSKEKGDH